MILLSVLWMGCPEVTTGRMAGWIALSSNKSPILAQSVIQSSLQWEFTYYSYCCKSISHHLFEKMQIHVQALLGP